MEREELIKLIIKRIYTRRIYAEILADDILRSFDVSGMFSCEKLEQAYKDGVRDALKKGYGTFDEENYR